MQVWTLQSLGSTVPKSRRESAGDISFTLCNIHKPVPAITACTQEVQHLAKSFKKSLMALTVALIALLGRQQMSIRLHTEAQAAVLSECCQLLDLA